jgi:hypothetical protein
MLANLFLYIGLILIATALLLAGRSHAAHTVTSTRTLRVAAVLSVTAAFSSLVFAVHLAGLLITA